LGEIAESAREGLLALAMGAGLQVMYAMMDTDVAAWVGPEGRHQPDRAAVRHGGEEGSVTLGRRRVAVRRPRVRAADGAGEVHLTILRLGVPPTLARTLRSTNPIESLISICRDHGA
jgi:hypothetical protein